MNINDLNLKQVRQALATTESAWYKAPPGARRLALGEACVALHNRQRQLQEAKRLNAILARPRK
jgi:hypothetical protein